MSAAVDLAHGLAADLDVVDHRILNLPVLFERLKIRQGLKLAGGAHDGFRNVPEVILNAFRVLHKGRAWRKTVPRNFGGNPFGVSTDTGTPSNFSASILKAASVKRLVDSPGSTSKVALVGVGAGQNRSEDAGAREAVTAR